MSLVAAARQRFRTQLIVLARLRGSAARGLVPVQTTVLHFSGLPEISKLEENACTIVKHFQTFQLYAAEHNIIRKCLLQVFLSINL